MKISSPAFAQETDIPVDFTCDGDDVNPTLTIEEIPENTKSLVLIMDDPDSPSGTFTHWTLWNIDPDVREIEEDSVPEGAVQGKTSFGKVGYGGPCPHQGKHRYYFKIYALDTKLDLGVGSDVHTLEDAMSGHVLEEAQLMGYYSRE